MRIGLGLIYAKEERDLSNGNKGTSTLIAVIVTLAVAGGGGFMLGQRSGQKSASMDTAVVAKVNGAKITKEDLYQRMVGAQGTQLVSQMIDEKLVDQAAEKAKVTVSAAEIDAEMKKLTEQIGGEAQLQAAMQQYGLTMEQVRRDREVRLKATKILAKDITVDDATLQKYYEENTSQFDKRQVHARHILVETEAEANAIKAQLDQGADFATLAKEKSTEPAAKTTGGDLGTFGHGKMDADFEKTVFSLKPNEISAPFRTQWGWHVAQVLEATGTAPTFESAKDDVKEAYIAQQVQGKIADWLDGLRKDADITNTLEEKKS